MGEDTENLRERLDRLERSMRRLQEDWTEVYGKFRTLQLRVAKQVQRLDEDSSHEEAPGDGSAAGSSGEGLPLSSLSPRARLIQSQIMQRRMAKEGGK